MKMALVEMILRPQPTHEMNAQPTSSEYSLSPSAQPSPKSSFGQFRAHCRRGDVNAPVYKKRNRKNILKK